MISDACSLSIIFGCKYCIQSVDPDDSEAYLFQKNHRSPAIRLWKPSPQNHSCD